MKTMQQLNHLFLGMMLFFVFSIESASAQYNCRYLSNIAESFTLLDHYIKVYRDVKMSSGLNLPYDSFWASNSNNKKTIIG